MKTFNWDISADSSESISHNTIITAFGDGYEQAVSFGINNRRSVWQCSKTDTKAVIDEILGFLLKTKGVEPFTFTPIKGEPAIKVHLDGEISRQKMGGDVWQIGFTLKQVF
ncbi:phage tail protein [Moraxella catarrhalis]|uniref:phage tail protein n=1 Tax=Moraxella catarrhalis TaxID=480 RepID=UPI0013D4B4D9|nr:phage tail protein [Moraxella catarrhalis]